jgi:hypothetical protein
MQKEAVAQFGSQVLPARQAKNDSNANVQKITDIMLITMEEGKSAMITK